MCEDSIRIRKSLRINQQNHIKNCSEVLLETNMMKQKRNHIKNQNTFQSFVMEKQLRHKSLNCLPGYIHQKVKNKNSTYIKVETVQAQFIKKKQQYNNKK